MSAKAKLVSNEQTTSDVVAAGRYRSYVARFPMRRGVELVHCLLTGANQLVPGQRANLLAACDIFATLEEHAGRLCAQLNLEPSERQTVQKQLKDLVDSGLLLPYEDVFARLKAPSISDEKTAITTLGIPTKDRPEALATCLRSYAECARHYGRELRFIIVDDSEAETTRETNRHNLKLIKDELGVEISYACTRDKQEFARKIAERGGLPPSVVDFALWSDEGCPVAVGSSRNALLLSTIGELLLQVDDDTVCRLARCPGYQEGITVTSSADQYDMWFESESDNGRMAVRNELQMEDIFQVHEQLLGRSISQCCSDPERALRLDGASALLFKRLQVAGTGKVVVTSLGLVGHSGMSESSAFLMMKGPKRSRLLCSEACYRTVLSNSQIITSVTSSTIGHTDESLYHNFGVDNRELLPPFMPVLRGEDIVFGKLLSSASWAHYFGRLPWVVEHATPPRTLAAADLWKHAGRREANQFCRMLADSMKMMHPTNSRKNLSRMAEMFVDVGSLPAAEFAETLTQTALRQTSLHIEHFDGLLALYGGQPEYWSDDVKMFQRIAQQAVLDKFFMVPIDLEAAFGGEAGLVLLQRLVRRFGELLAIWPKVREAAQDLRQSGYQFGTTI